jgi:hypothetical protein
MQIGEANLPGRDEISPTMSTLNRSLSLGMDIDIMRIGCSAFSLAIV